MHSVYVYYRVPQQTSAAVRAAVGRILEAVAALAGVRGRLLRRRDQPDTWMEVYEGIRDDAAFDRVLEAAVAGSGFAEASAGAARHAERFVPLELDAGDAPRRLA